MIRGICEASDYDALRAKNDVLRAENTRLRDEVSDLDALRVRVAGERRAGFLEAVELLDAFGPEAVWRRADELRDVPSAGTAPCTHAPERCVSGLCERTGVCQRTVPRQEGGQ